MPILSWIGKDKVVNHDKELPFRVLKPVKELSIGNDPGNLLIEGDNLEALKALMPFYYSKVKCIYIDPPYNTGNEKWVYNDRVNSPQIKAWINDVVGAEGEDLCRHDKWLCMMYPRLKVLRDLLSEDGAIFISIDDNEVDNLKMIMNEIFGGENFITTIVVKMSHLSGVKMSHMNKKLPKLKEYVLMYAKNKQHLQVSPVYENTSWEKAFSRYKSFVVVDEKDESDYSKWKVISLKRAMEEAEIDLSDENAVNRFCLENAHRIFRTARNRSAQFTSLPSDTRFRPVTTSSGLKKLAYKKEEVLFAQSKLKRTMDTDNSTIMEPLGDLWTDIGINNLHNEGGVVFRNGKKPLKLIKRILNMCPDKNAIILDSMAGSGTTGHAVLELNKEDGGNRKFILIELERNIARTLTADRLQKAIQGYQLSEFQAAIGQGFQYLDLNGELYDHSGYVNPDARYEDMAAYIYFTETQTYLDIAEIQNPFIGSQGSTHFFLFFKGKAENILDETTLKKTEGHSDIRVIYADKCLLDEEYLAKRHIVFKQIPYELKKY